MVMASALLASRTEPCWGGERKVVYTSTNQNPNPSPNSTPPRHDDGRQNHLQTIEPAALPTASTSAAAASDDSSSNPKPLYRRRKETGRYVTYNISNYSKEELRELKRKLVSEVELVRRVTSRVESTAASSSVVQPSVKKKLTAGMMKRCSQILTKLMKHAGAVWFRAPVDVVALKLYDYHQIIKDPMDLGTVRSRLRKGLYPSPADFAADVRLTFNNALIYNPPGHDVHMFAGLLLRQFESSFASAYQRYGKQLAAIYRAEAEREREREREFASSWSRPPAPLPESQTWFEQAPVAIPSPEQSVAPPPPPLPQKKQQQPPPKTKGKKKRGRPMSLAEKESLTSALEELPEEKTEELLQIIRKRNAEMVDESSGGEVELDFELMDNETLWELARFVSSNCKKKKKKKQKRRNPSEYVAPSPMAAAAAAAAAEKSADDEDVDICGDDDNLPVVTNYPPMEIGKDTISDNNTSSSSSGSASSSSSSSSDGSSSGSDDDDDAQSPAPRN